MLHVHREHMSSAALPIYFAGEIVPMTAILDICPKVSKSLETLCVGEDGSIVVVEVHPSLLYK